MLALAYLKSRMFGFLQCQVCKDQLNHPGHRICEWKLCSNPDSLKIMDHLYGILISICFEGSLGQSIECPVIGIVTVIVYGPP